jgi:hypothetical protein
MSMDLYSRVELLLQELRRTDKLALWTALALDLFQRSSTRLPVCPSVLRTTQGSSTYRVSAILVTTASLRT